MNRHRTRALALALFLLLCSCSHTVRLGAINHVDSDAFDVLGVWQYSLDQLKADCPSGPTSPCPQARKDAINRIGDAYNVTRQAWLSYRSAVKAGGAGDQQALSNAIAALLLAGENYRRSFQK